jgi:hypothetical protein
MTRRINSIEISLKNLLKIFLIDFSLLSVETFFVEIRYLKSGNCFCISLNDIKPLIVSLILFEFET